MTYNHMEYIMEYIKAADRLNEKQRGSCIRTAAL